ncbi:hypothetical protein [Pantoea dispersa]|uniref:hypothetical protein n=1 Tax=Pantoea dispersa TaxID=59814 RepID=UPI0039B563C4
MKGQQMELKDVLTPLVTLAGVWLAARFTLRNEVQKKALEIRTARLESIAAECSDALTGLRNYAGSAMHIIEMVFRMKAEQISSAATLAELRISVEELGNHVSVTEGSNRALNTAKIRHCRHLLAFHRPTEACRWDETVFPLLDTLNDFLMITMPGEPVRDMKNVMRSADDELAFRQTLYEQLLEVKQFQKDLTASLSEEFISLTQPAPVSAADRLRRWRQYLLPERFR